MKIYIYCLFDDKNIPFYIGKTKNSLKVRESQHRRRLHKELNIFELDYINEKDWKFWEKHYISLYKSWGFILTNKNNGGGGLSFHKEESKYKMKGMKHKGTSEKLKGRSRPDVSKKFLGKTASKETKEKMRQSRIDHPMYDDPKRGQKIRKSNKKHYKPNSDRNKTISVKLIGRKAEWMKFRNKPVFQKDLKGNIIKEWSSASEAGKFLGKNSSAISECCTGKRKTAYKFKWNFKTNG